MKSEVKVYEYENGEIQRVQIIRLDDWSKIDFLRFKQESVAGQIKSLNCFYDIYKNFLVPTCPWIFPQMVMFCLPEGEGLSDSLTTASIVLKDGVRLRGGKPVFTTPEAKQLYEKLDAKGCVKIVCGKLPSTKIIPVGNFVGLLSENETDAKMKVNANFFIMDPFDCATIYDQVGTPFGLCVKKGVVTNPPLFGREALLVDKEKKVSIRQIDLRELEIEIAGVRYKHGQNATIYTRPERKKTPRIEGVCLVIIGNRVVAVKEKGPVEIPASGFVLRVDCVDAKPNDEVVYHGLEEVTFGIQVGNSIIRDGKKTMEFISRFYNLYHLEPVPFPPSLYPMDFENARAARMAIGADADDKPVIFWAEGKGKLGYTPGEDSTGASLSEMAEIAADLGLKNAINLDGGGSAQVLLNNARTLRISDRNKEDNSDAERLVPLGLIVK